MSNKILFKIKVEGRVQGVGFRWSAAREARNLGLAGFVKNMPDGSVYIEAEGTREDLDDFVNWCKIGPPFSSVETVEVGSFPTEGYSEFIISH